MGKNEETTFEFMRRCLMGAEMSIRLIKRDKIIFRMLAFSEAAYGS